MRGNYTAHLTPQLRVLSEDQIEEIHLAALRILEEVGIHLTHPEALELLHGAGAYVGEGSVRIPSFLVEEAIRSAPKRITLYGRDGKPAMFLEDHRSYYGPNSDCPDYLDPFTGQRRPCTLKDVAAMATVFDYLPNLNFILEAGIATDVDPNIADRAIFKELLTHTTKPILTCFSRGADHLMDVLDMAAAAAGGHENLRQRPFTFHYAEPISPLTHYPDGVAKLLLCAERGIPVIYIPMPMAGSTAPATLAGVLAQCNAEVLGGLVMHQVKSRGAPFIYGGIPSMMDMKTTVVSYGAPEMPLMSAGLTDMAHHHRLPVFSTGGCGDGKAIDAQLAAEQTITCLMATLSGANLIHDFGLMDAAQMISPEAAVLGDEIVGMVKRIMGGIPVDEDTLALDVVREVGPGGNYLAQEHTFRHFREMWYSQLFERTLHQSWLKGDRSSVAERINKKTREILQTHQAEPLPEDVLAELVALERGWAE